MLEKALFFLPCLYIFWLCKIFEVSNMEAISPLTAILTREQVGRVVEKIEPAPWITVHSVLMKQQVHPSHDAATLELAVLALARIMCAYIHSQNGSAILAQARFSAKRN